MHDEALYAERALRAGARFTVTSNASSDVVVRRYNGTGANQDHVITSSGTVTVLTESTAYPCPYTDEDEITDPNEMQCCGNLP